MCHRFMRLLKTEAKLLDLNCYQYTRAGIAFIG